MQLAIVTVTDTALVIEDEVESFNHMALGVATAQLEQYAARELSPAHFQLAPATH